jgi:hypothetical protein
MFEEEVGGELQSQPLFELDDQIHRVRRIEAQPSECDIWLDLQVREVERARQILHAPVADPTFAGVVWSQENPRIASGQPPGCLTAAHSAGQGSKAVTLCRIPRKMFDPID